MFPDYWGMLGYTNNAKMMMETFSGSSGIILTDNPEYTLCDFKSVFPVFLFQNEDPQEGIPIPVFNLFLSMGNAAIKYDRYKNHWKYILSLFIAHYLTLYLQTQSGDPGSLAALQSSMPKGIATSKSVDGLSISYDFMDIQSDFAKYGTYKLTIYGMQLITLTKMYGGFGMWVNG